MSEERTCALCGDAIEDGQAWMEDDGNASRIAHSGCVYSAGEAAGDGRWRPAEVG